MKDKASQKTEDEILQTLEDGQTFQEFDEDMTSQTQDQTQDNAGAAKSDKKKSGSSQNMIIFIGAGVAAMLILGYTFVIKPKTNKQPERPAVTQTAPSNQSEHTESPVTTAVTPPPVVTPPQNLSPERQTAQDFLNAGNNQPVVTPPASTPNVVTQPPVVVAPNNGVAVVGDLSKRFEDQSNGFKIALDEVGNRVSNLERFKDEQLVVNKNVDERLVKLESQRGNNNSNVTNVSSNANTTKKESKPVRHVERKSTVRHTATRNVKAENVVVRESTTNDSNVLIDKSSRTPVKSVRERDVVPEYNIHSIYGGRVWLKNSDGSLSTFTTGDKLPNGELIKGVDDEKYSITTDSKTIIKK